MNPQSTVSTLPPSPLLATLAGEIDREKCRVQSGDLWQLGEHRLLCGDCTHAEAIQRLMQGEQADLLFTDPPYGVGYQSKTRDAKRPTPLLTNDTLGTLATFRLLVGALRMVPLKAGGVFYICSSGGETETLFRFALDTAELPLKQSIVWVKQHFVLSRQDYHWRHETLLYGWKLGEGHYFVPDRTQDTVWEIPRLTRSPWHPTTKPLALVRRAIENSSRPGEIVYDGFGGSGTTLLACEETGRGGRMIEIEAGYCAVVLQRWEQATGRTAHLLSTAATL